MDIDKGTIIYLEDEQYFTLPKYVTKVRLEVHGGRGGRGGNSYSTTEKGRGKPGNNGSRISCILDLSKVPTPSRTLYAVKGHNGANGGYGKGTGGGGGGGGSSAILLGDILIIQARGGAGGNGGYYDKNSTSGDKGEGGKGYINGKDGLRGYLASASGIIAGGRGGDGGGSNYIFEGLERVDATIEYTPGLLLLEVLETQTFLIIKSNNKYYTYQDNEFIEVEPTAENFMGKSIYLSDLTTPTDRVVIPMEDGKVLENGRLYRKTIDISKYKDIERIEVNKGQLPND